MFVNGRFALHLTEPGLGLVAQTWPSTCYIITAVNRSRLHKHVTCFKRYIKTDMSSVMCY